MNTPQETQNQNLERIIYLRDLPNLLRVGKEAVRRYIKAGKIPKPDFELSKRTRGWKLSTLRDNGIGVL